MTADVDERVEVILDVDLDAKVPCTVWAGPCDREAVWASMCRACRTEWTACDDHRRKTDYEGLIHFQYQGRTPNCSRCRAPMPIPAEWRPL
jgi:hypothetical protein